MTDKPADGVRTAEGLALLDRLGNIEAVPVEWAPAHSAPYVSQYIVLPLVEMGILAIEAAARDAAINEALEAVRGIDEDAKDPGYAASPDYFGGYGSGLDDAVAAIEALRKGTA